MTDLIQTLNDVDILNADIKHYLEGNIDYQNLISGIDTALEESQAIVVVTASDVSAAANYISNFKKISKNVESIRKRLVQPLVDKKTEIDTFFKNIPLKYQDELERLEKELLDFKKKEQAEAQKRADEEKQRLEEKALNEAIENGREEPAIVPEVIPQTKKISELNSSKVHSRRTKKAVVVDFVKFVRSLTDDQIKLYLEPNMKAINAERSKYDYEAKSTLAGIEFTFDESIV
jgi:hypothetical protein